MITERDIISLLETAIGHKTMRVINTDSIWNHHGSSKDFVDTSTHQNESFFEELRNALEVGDISVLGRLRCAIRRQKTEGLFYVLLRVF